MHAAVVYNEEVFLAINKKRKEIVNREKLFLKHAGPLAVLEEVCLRVQVLDKQLNPPYEAREQPASTTKVHLSLISYVIFAFLYAGLRL